MPAKKKKTATPAPVKKAAAPVSEDCHKCGGGITGSFSVGPHGREHARGECVKPTKAEKIAKKIATKAGIVMPEGVKFTPAPENNLQDGGGDGDEGGKAARKQPRRKMDSADAPARVAPEATAAVPAKSSQKLKSFRASLLAVLVARADVLARPVAREDVQADAAHLAWLALPAGVRKYHEDAAKDRAKALAESARKKRLADNGGTPELFYERMTKKFWFKDDGEFEDYEPSMLKLHLVEAGVSEYNSRNGIYDIDRCFLEAQQDRKVDYAGSLPGYRIGVHTVEGRKMLVTQEAKGVWDKLPDTDPVEPKFFTSLVGALLAEHKQWFHLFNSWAVDLRALRRNDGVFEHHDFKPAPFTAIIGIANAGKSLLQSFRRAVLGGRRENPAKSMMEGEKFTAPLIKAEHWSFGDPPGFTDMRSRLLFADKTKEFCHERDFVFRGMNKEGFKVPCYRRVDGSFNDQEEDLLKLYPMRPGIQDKTNLYRCGSAVEVMKEFLGQQTLPKVGVESVDGVDGSLVGQAIQREAPLIRHWLLKMFPSVPDSLKQTPYASRYGIDPFWHPGLLQELSQFSPERSFLGYVTELLFLVPEDQTPHSAERWSYGPTDAEFVTLKAVDLEKFLALSRYKDALKNFLRSVGHVLGRCAANMPDQVSKLPLKHGEVQTWKIKNPYHPSNKPKEENEN